MRSVSFSDKSEQSLKSSDSYQENILVEFAKSVKSSVRKFSFLKRAKSSCYQVNKHNVSSWDIGRTGSIGSDSLSFDGNSSTRRSTKIFQKTHFQTRFKLFWLAFLYFQYQLSKWKGRRELGLSDDDFELVDFEFSNKNTE